MSAFHSFLPSAERQISTHSKHLWTLTWFWSTNAWHSWASIQPLMERTACAEQGFAALKEDRQLQSLPVPIGPYEAGEHRSSALRSMMLWGF
jgi:hypothetical protein